ncbi:MAG TPA: alpha/beta hydrolase [Tahibacter sp.]|nr:alpha/beta hydrolase [Tahibacter sp.]
MSLAALFVRWCCAALFAAAAFDACAAPAADTVASRSAVVDGVKIHYLQAGSGSATPVVLLHGFGQNSHMWKPVIAKLAAHRVVVAPDLRGAGDSDKPANGYDKKTMAQDIHALVTSLKLGKVRIAGHDIGLMVAYAYAAQYPDEVERIALMEAFLPGVGDWTQVWLLRDLWHFHFYGETPLKLVTGREKTYLEHFWNDFAADRTKSISESDRDRYAAAYAQPKAVWAGMEWFRAFEQDAKDFAGFAQTPLTMPMLVLSGEKAGGQFLIDQGHLVDKNVQGMIVKGSGHWLLEEAPDQTIPALVAFLGR